MPFWPLKLSQDNGRWVGTAGVSLVAGAAILLALLTANLSTYVVPAETAADQFQYEPSHVPWLQRRLAPALVSERVVSLLSPDGAAPEKRVFASSPRETVRTGQSFEYRPLPSVPVTEYALEGAPDGMFVDQSSGLIGGSPSMPGRYDVVLSGRIDDDRRVQQHFVLFVDDRWLVLGADSHGRDVLWRLVSSTKYTIIPGLIAVAVSVLLGTLLGAWGGFYHGVARRVLQGTTAVIQSVPGLLIVFLAGAIWEYNVYALMVVAGLILLPETANGVFERVESFRRRDFVEAARELGMPDRTILWDEIVWHNVRSFLLTRVTQGFVFAILIEVTLSYLGLIDRETPQLGGMLVEGREALFGDRTSLLAVASLGALLLIIAGFTLTEKGVLRLWERRR